MFPIISSIIFCGTHDIALRGKEASGGNFNDLLQFRIESGGQILKEHFETCKGNAKYTSHRIQNEIINVCGLLLRKNIVLDLNSDQVLAFSLLADESADISGTEQLVIYRSQICYTM